MATSWKPRVTNCPSAPMTLFSKALLVLSLVVTTQTAAAEALPTFEATFRISVSKIPTPVKATMSLQPLEQYPDHYRMKFEIDSWIMQNTEKSVFAWRDCQPRTDHYVHEFKGFGRHRWHHMQFYRHPPRVINKSEEEKTEYEIKDDTLDELTLLLKAGCALRAGKDSYAATTAYGDDLRESRFRVIDRETVKTPAGKLDTIVVEKQRDEDSERRTIFWVAPDLHYLVVRAKHIENPALFGELILTDYQGPPPGSSQQNGDEDLRHAAK
jgi:hypothetical protein